MSNAIADTSMAQRRTLDLVSKANDKRELDTKADALVAELRKVRANVDSLLRASDLASLKAERDAA
ncbi:protein of unknown function [Candidatus Filomicrobium marinum]|uniref:Uncharacterized protein n=2 Tax=Filomicrobium TaxID=119044 RepID=A0A0D6JHI7_9HYPH|nr:MULTISPECIES: hypothetical protein [Filomicrobium]MCV0369497.1 hypothetical protein [Filomicrobium sp.]CFX44028.1 protein of unknown function [Candidatus Filomicrobium marinum]CPR20910.1 protein of unknown function [Candidatus Filomicrobium marinum]SDP20923.1 hypothetical protein SAMN04488061_2505 [Filomicrobium insigne]